MRSSDRLRHVSRCAAAIARARHVLVPRFSVTLAAIIVGFGACVASAAQLTATWTDNANGTAQFKVERKTGAAGTYSQIAITATGATSYLDSTIATDTTYCYRVRASNAAGDSAYSNEACASVSTFDVGVTKAGTGAGTVVTSPTGIDCGTTCFHSFTAGAVVTLSAAPAPGSVFGGWSGGGCAGTAACTISGNGAMTITATFSTVPSYLLTVTRSGTGAGTVTSSPAGINCGSTCTESVTALATVTLTATPASGSTFSGWSGGGCSGTGTCTVTVSSATTVDAAFTAATTMYRLDVQKAGTGTGTIVSSPAGIDCGTACSSIYPKGTTVTLTATPAPGSRFTGWSGGSRCRHGTVKMWGNRSCTANFN